MSIGRNWSSRVLFIICFVCFQVRSQVIGLTPLRWTDETPRCIPLPQSSPCYGFVPYNYTEFPNLANQTDPEDATSSLVTFDHLIRTNCSPFLKHFLCSAYFPMCTKINFVNVPMAGRFANSRDSMPVDDSHVSVPPCRTLCVEAKTSCEPILTAFGFQWPTILSCSKFPERNEGESMCMDYNIDETNRNKGSTMFRPDDNSLDRSGSRTKHLENIFKQITSKIDKAVDPVGQEVGTTTDAPSTNVPFLYEPTLPPAPRKPLCYNLDLSLRKSVETHPDKFIKVNRSGQYNCHQMCNADVRYTLQQKQSTQIIFALISVCGFVCCAALFFSSFCRSNERNASPNRIPATPIRCMALSLLFVSLGFLIRIAGGRKIGCFSLTITKDNSQWFITDPEIAPSFFCVIVFFTTYYFALTAQLWGMLLSFLWMLEQRTVRRFGTGFQLSGTVGSKIISFVTKKELVLHFFVWLIPLIPTVIVLILGKVESDELLSWCSVGQQSSADLLRFSIIPFSIIAGAAIFFVICGVVSIIQQDSYADHIAISSHTGSTSSGSRPSSGSDDYNARQNYLHNERMKNEHFYYPPIEVIPRARRNSPVVPLNYEPSLPSPTPPPLPPPPAHMYRLHEKPNPFTKQGLMENGYKKSKNNYAPKAAQWHINLWIVISWLVILLGFICTMVYQYIILKQAESQTDMKWPGSSFIVATLLKCFFLLVISLLLPVYNENLRRHKFVKKHVPTVTISSPVSMRFGSERNAYSASNQQRLPGSYDGGNFYTSTESAWPRHLPRAYVPNVSQKDESFV